jgi:carbonic anhydrase
MTEQIQQTPMNISPQNISGTCNYKCEFSFDYPISGCTVTNNGNYLMLSFNNLTASVTFNNSKYNISSCYLYSPSLQLYNNQNANGEIMLLHQPTNGGKNLYVCIPLSVNGNSNNGSNKISEIIDSVSKGAPSQGGSTSQGISEFSLNDFIPMKEFYSYSNNNIDVVAFGLQNAISISQNKLDLLKKIIKPYSGLAFPSGPKLFSNTKGPTKGKPATSNDIYIDCQPTNSSEDEINEVVNIKSEKRFDINNLLSNQFVVSFLLIFIFIILIIGTYKGLNYMSGGGNGGTGRIGAQSLI